MKNLTFCAVNVTDVATYKSIISYMSTIPNQPTDNNVCNEYLDFVVNIFHISYKMRFVHADELSPVDNTTLFQRLYDVYTTSPTSYRCLIDVETTSYVYWLFILVYFI